MPINPDLRHSLISPADENLVAEIVPIEQDPDKRSNFPVVGAVAVLGGLGLVACSPTGTVSEQPTNQEPTPILPTSTPEKPTLTPGNVGGDTEIGKEPVGSTTWDGLERYPASFNRWLQSPESGFDSSYIWIFEGDFRSVTIARRPDGTGAAFFRLNSDHDSFIVSAEQGNLVMWDENGARVDNAGELNRIDPQESAELLRQISGIEKVKFGTDDLYDGWRAWYKVEGSVSEAKCLVSPVVEVGGRKGVLIVSPQGEILGFLERGDLALGAAVEWQDVQSLVTSEIGSEQVALEPTPTTEVVPPTPTLEPTPTTEVPPTTEPTPVPEQTKPMEYTIPAGANIPVYKSPGEASGSYVKVEVILTIIREEGEYVLASHVAPNGKTYEAWFKRSDLDRAVAPRPTPEPVISKEAFMLTDRPNRQTTIIKSGDGSEYILWAADREPTWINLPGIQSKMVAGKVTSINLEQRTFDVNFGANKIVTIRWSGEDSTDRFKSHLMQTNPSWFQTYEGATLGLDVQINDTVVFQAEGRGGILERILAGEKVIEQWGVLLFK